MRFNKDSYVSDYLKPRRRVTSLPVDDLLQRYALTLPATEVDITAQIKAVRAYWNGVSTSSSYAQVCKLCKTEDERLKQQFGDALLKPAWWQQRASAAGDAARIRVGEMAGYLREGYGQLSVVTRSIVDDFTLKLGLQPASGLEAAAQAGLTVIDEIALPEGPEIGSTQFKHLGEYLNACAAPTLPALLHPDSGPFTLLERYACLGDPSLRLDAVAVKNQLDQAERRGNSAANTALQAALNLLRHAAGTGVGLDRLALYHLVSLVSGYVSLGMGATQKKLVELGLEPTEAAVLAILLAQQSAAVGGRGIAQVENLLAEGRLNEAGQVARALPEESENRVLAERRVSEAKARLDEVLAQAEQARAVPDEARAAVLLREAAAISLDHAGEALTTLPLPPPGALQLTGDGESVKLRWQPSSGSGEDVTYLITCSVQGLPVTPADGEQVARQDTTTLTHRHAPVARTVHYAVFAETSGRPSSRPSTASIVLLPEVLDLKAEVGPSEVTLHWATHPAVEEVEVMRTSPGTSVAPVRLPVRGNSCGLAGLAEGEALHFEVTALYRGLDGLMLRSSTTPVNATPRSQARPIAKLRARPVQVAGQVRVRVSWTPVDNSDVRIQRSAVAAPWPVGSWVSADDVARFGTEVAGRRSTGRSELAIEAELPPGVHHLVPFSTGGTGTVVGQSTVVGVTDPVTGLRATAFADYATISWRWPESSQMAEVSWALDGDEDFLTIGRAEYEAKGAVRVPLGREPCAVEVRAMIHAQGTSFTSPPAGIVIDAVTDVQISYSVSSTMSLGPFGGRTKKLTFVSPEGCRDVYLRVIASPGLVMPTSAEGALVLLDVPLELSPGVPLTHQVSVPRSFSRPYWVRGFVVGGRARLLDPPVAQLKEV